MTTLHPQGFLRDFSMIEDQSTRQSYLLVRTRLDKHDSLHLRSDTTIASKDYDVWRLQSNTFQKFNDCSVSVSVDLRRLFSSFDHGE